MPITERTHEQEAYRFGFNSQERDDNINGTGNINTAEFWSYDTRLGRRWNMDPVIDPSISPYFCLEGNPLLMTDEHGDMPTPLKGPYKSSFSNFFWNIGTFFKDLATTGVASWNGKWLKNNKSTFKTPYLVGELFKKYGIPNIPDNARNSIGHTSRDRTGNIERDVIYPHYKSIKNFYINFSLIKQGQELSLYRVYHLTGREVRVWNQNGDGVGATTRWFKSKGALKFHYVLESRLIRPINNPQDHNPQERGATASMIQYFIITRQKFIITPNIDGVNKSYTIPKN